MTYITSNYFLLWILYIIWKTITIWKVHIHYINKSGLMLHASYDHSKQSSDQSLPRLCLSTIDENNSEVEMLLLIKETKSQKVFSFQFRHFDIFLHSCTFTYKKWTSNFYKPVPRIILILVSKKIVSHKICISETIQKTRLMQKFNLWTDKTIHVHLSKKLNNRSQKE